MAFPTSFLLGGMTDKPYEVKKHVAGFKFWRLIELVAGKTPKFSGHYYKGDCFVAYGASQ